MLPRFAQDLGAAPELTGLIVGASTITGVFIKFPAGAISDILGRRRMMILGGLFFAFPPFLYTFVMEPYALLALRFLHGFATAIFSPIASAYVASFSADKRGEKLGWFAAANEVGSTLGPVLGGLLLFVTASYRLTYIFVGILGLLSLSLMLMISADSSLTVPQPTSNPNSRWKTFRIGMREVVTHRRILLASAMEACLFLGVGALVGFLPLYAKGEGLNDAQIGILLGTQLVAAMVGKPLAGKISDQIGRKPMIVTGLTLCAVSLPLIAMVSLFWILLFLCTLFGIGMAIVTPSTNALVADLAKEGQLGAAMGVFGTIWDMGEALGPIVAGLLIGVMGYFLSFSVIAVIMLVGTLIFALWVSDPVVFSEQYRD